MSTPDIFGAGSHYQNGLLLVHCEWLQQVLNEKKIPDINFPKHPNYSDDEIKAFLLDCKVPPSAPGNQNYWRLISTERYAIKDKNVLPSFLFNTGKPEDSRLSEDASFSEVLEYIEKNNFTGLWHENFEKYSSAFKIRNDSSSNTSKLPLSGKCIKYYEAFLLVITRIYRSPIINLQSTENTQQQTKYINDYLSRADDDFNQPNHIDQVLITLLCDDEIILLKPFREFTIRHALQFSPNFLGDAESRLKTLFVLYQVLEAIDNLHAIGINVGDFHLHDIHIDKHYLTSLAPDLQASLVNLSNEKLTNSQDSISSEYCKGMSDVAVRLIKSLENIEMISVNEHDSPSFLQSVVKMWICGAITNFDYIMILNYISGRKFDNPNYYPVLPWVRDFSSKNGGWRDLSKSKYRLNKGDQQLDLTYDGQKAVLSQKPNVNDDDDFMLSQRMLIETPPHHISDVLSEITYYVYKSRITSKEVLCRHVRNRWVPAEYPSSMQRLQAWTPDECIPDFFTNTAIFTSKHSDLNDLELPDWCNKNAKKFIDYHMDSLESSYVSDRLHHWIDLTFGYKLSGSSAIRAKNVCLHVVNSHSDLQKHGVIQLFGHPHPIRQTSPAIYWNSNATKLLENMSIQKMYSNHDFKDNLEDTSNCSTAIQEKKRSSTSSDSGNQVKSKFSGNNDIDKSKQTIFLPKDFDMGAAINELDNFNTFLIKNGDYPNNDEASKSHGIQSDDSGKVVALQNRRKQDIIIIGIFILELYMPQKFINIGSNANFRTRLDCAKRIVKNEPHNIPLPVKTVVMKILDNEDDQMHESRSTTFKFVSEEGLPPLTAQQLLHPTLSLLPFPKSFKSYAKILRLLHNIQLTRDYKSNNSSFNSEIEQTVAEVKIKMVAVELSTIIEDLPRDHIKLILPALKSLFQDTSTSILAVWFLFEPLSKALGPSQTCIHLLEYILNIYEENSQTTKHLKLYHRTFLLNMLVRLGMKTFLKYFVTYIIEAVGGYKDFDDRICKEGLTKSWHTVGLSNSSSALASPERMSNSTTSTPVFEKRSFSSKKEEYPGSNIEEQKTPGDEFTEGEIFDFDNASSKEASKQGDNTDLRISNIRNPFSPQPIVVPSALDNLKDSADIGEHGENLNKGKETNISDIALESVIWLSHRIGPVLSAKYLSRNLLKMLNLCYNEPDCFLSDNDEFRDQKIRISRHKIKGDELAYNVLESLSGLVALYGEQLILLQYLPYAWDLISLCRQKRGGKLTPNLEGGLLGCMSLVHHMIPYLSSDSVLMNELSDGLLARVLFPVLQVATSRCLVFTGGWRPRIILIYKLLDVVYLIGLRIGEEMARVHLTPICSALFAAFDKAYDPFGKPLQSKYDDQASARLEDINYAPSEMLVELSQVLIPELAYDIYVTFYHLVGRAHLDSNIPNLDLIQVLCSSFKEKDAIRPVTFAHFRQIHVAFMTQESPNSPIILAASSGSRGGNMVSIGSDASNVAGNSQKMSISSNEGSTRSALLQSLILKEKSVASRHLKGNWLAYWEHETGRPDTDQSFVLKQIPLQSFIGHNSGSGVKCLHVLDNENSFLSGGGSKDRTVKVWSLRSQGDGTISTAPQWSYTSHKKSIQNISYLENLRWVISCDSTVHLWDPFVGSMVHIVDPVRLGQVSAMTTNKAGTNYFGPGLR